MSDHPHQLSAFDFACDEHGHGTHAIDLDGHVQAFHPSVRDALIEQGLLYMDREHVWHLRTHGFPDLHPTSPQGYLAICDFCSERPACWNIPCESFWLPQGFPSLPQGRSVGDWAACDFCGCCIAAWAKERFLVHCLERHDRPDAPRELRRALRKMQQQLHARFWRHYQGGAVRHTPRPYGH